MSRSNPTEFTLANTAGGKRPTKDERKDDNKSQRFHGSGTGFSQIINKRKSDIDRMVEGQTTDSNN